METITVIDAGMMGSALEFTAALKDGYALGIAPTIRLNQKVLGIDSKLHLGS